MPQVISESAGQPRPRRGQHIIGRRTRRQAARSPVRATRQNQHLALLAMPSPAIGDTCTTHNQMLFWVGWFARFHTDGPPYVPYEIKTIDCPVVHGDGSPVLRSDGQQQMMRCVREMSRTEVKNTVEWHIISWNVGQPGASFQRCASHDEAIVIFHAPPSPVLLP